MQRRRLPPGQRRLWNWMFVLVLAILFVALVAASCTANPHLYGGRGLVVFVPDSTPLLSPF